jgi:hypothetical protein
MYSEDMVVMQGKKDKWKEWRYKKGVLDMRSRG